MSLKADDFRAARGDTDAHTVELPANLAVFEESTLSHLLTDTFSRNYISIVAHEVIHTAEHNPDRGAINDWEGRLLTEHS